MISTIQLTRNLFLALSTVFILTAFTPVETPVAEWVRLGSRTVNYKVDRDVIKVTPRDGALTALKFEVNRGALTMHKMIIHFKNGDEKVVNTKMNFTRAGGSRVIDLPGNKRMIEKVVFYYDTKNRSRRKARVVLYGRS